MKVSIVLATYNGAQHISEQLRSFEAQSEKPYEVIIVDDGSKDHTVDVIKEWMGTSALNIRLFPRDVNKGVLATFHEAASLARGDIIMFSDQDDSWFEDKLIKVKEVFKTQPDIMVVINDQIIADENLKPSTRTKLSNLRASGHSVDDFITGCCTSFRKEWLDFLGGIPVAADKHDLWVNYPAILLGCRVVLETPLQLYRRHGNTVTTWEVSRSKRPSIEYRLRRFGLNNDDPRERIRTQLVVGDLLVNRFKAQTGPAAISSKLPKIIDYLDDRNRSLNARLRLAELPRVRRIKNIISLARRGGYRHFSGVRSMLKDLIR